MSETTVLRVCNSASQQRPPSRASFRGMRKSIWEGAGIRPAEWQSRESPPFRPEATILHLCCCQDCEHRDDAQGVPGFRRYVPGEDYHPAMRRFWTDVGMIRPDQWYRCAEYHGPLVSKNVWVCPRVAPSRATLAQVRTSRPDRFRAYGRRKVATWRNLARIGTSPPSRAREGRGNRRGNRQSLFSLSAPVRFFAGGPRAVTGRVWGRPGRPDATGAHVGAIRAPVAKRGGVSAPRGRMDAVGAYPGIAWDGIAAWGGKARRVGGATAPSGPAMRHGGQGDTNAD